MAGKNELEAREKQEVTRDDHAERTRTRGVYSPRADIHETKEALHVTADMAGVDEQSLNITLEKNVLTILGATSSQAPEGMELIYQEYEVGDYERSFVLSEDINRKGISAKVKNGVLDLTLPKCLQAKVRKIPVTAA